MVLETVNYIIENKIEYLDKISYLSDGELNNTDIQTTTIYYQLLVNAKLGNYDTANIPFLIEKIINLRKTNNPKFKRIEKKKNKKVDSQINTISLTDIRFIVNAIKNDNIRIFIKLFYLEKLPITFMDADYILQKLDWDIKGITRHRQLQEKLVEITEDSGSFYEITKLICGYKKQESFNYMLLIYLTRYVIKIIHAYQRYNNEEK